ncbi:MAG TPA: GtrA family protein [Opitutaceae bacterium]
MPTSSIIPPRETRMRMFRFLAVGGGAAVVQILAIAALKYWMSDTWAFTISWIISTLTHYLANRFWALPSARSDAAKQLGEYLFTVALSYVINVLAFKACREWLGLSIEWATVAAIPPSTVVVFLMLNYRVFKADAAKQER